MKKIDLKKKTLRRMSTINNINFLVNFVKSYEEIKKKIKNKFLAVTCDTI